MVGINAAEKDQESKGPDSKCNQNEREKSAVVGAITSVEGEILFFSKRDSDLAGFVFLQISSLLIHVVFLAGNLFLLYNIFLW